MELVIFDCDGVLVDSEPLAARIDAEMLGELGWAITADEVAARFVGRSSLDVRVEIEGHLDRPLPAGWEDEARRRFFRLARRELVAVEGVRGVLDHLVGAGIALCVASNSERERIRFTLDHTGLSGYFAGRVFSGHEVAHPKPAPDLFLLAATTMGFDPSETVVIEDSAVGVEAARRAGMAVFAYAGGLGDGRLLAGPGTTVFSDMRRLADLLAADPEGAEPAAQP